MTETKPSHIDVLRYKKLRRFFAGVIFHFIFWDILLNRPVLRFFRKAPLPRWQTIARRFRDLAVEMGGVLIKLGQFLSIRVDLLPREVTHELAGLQDEVPPVKSEEIIRQIESAFGRPVHKIFKWFNPEPLGSASLAQVHPVVLFSDEPAVVKVLRPNIDILVETDLSAINLAFGWLKHYKKLRRRVDLDWLSEEFGKVTRRELDLQAEGKNAERFASDFSGHPDVYFPKIHWECSTDRVLTMENVGYIKISDVESMTAAGIDPILVADTLYNLYMKQVFETYFVHVDPHPGNLFIKPMPVAEEIEAGISGFLPDDPVPPRPNRPFQIVFIDFGMMVHVPERLRSAIRRFAIGIGTRDAHKIVQSLIDAGGLLENTDLTRLEEAHEALFRQFWGVQVGQMRDVALKNVNGFISNYRDIVYEAPFQFQADMIFVVRAVGILAGMAANLDPLFDVWAKTIPYAGRFAQEELRQNRRGLVEEASLWGRIAFKLPEQIDRVLTQSQRGKLRVQTGFTPESRKAVESLEQTVRALGKMVLASACILSGVVLFCNEKGETLMWCFFGAAVFLFIQSYRK